MDASATPAHLGFRMPAEWEPHEATWIAWPHERNDWPGKFAAIPWVYAEIVSRLQRSEIVRILVNDSAARRKAERKLRQVGLDLSGIEFNVGRISNPSGGTYGRVRNPSYVEFIEVPTNRVWTRDYGPLFIRDPAGTVAVTDWGFNGWAKYDNWRRDDAVPAQLAPLLGMRRWEVSCAGQRVVLEGGSIDVNGQGMLLTTEECLLSSVQARNPGLTRDQLERVFAEYLGVRKVLWLGRGIAGDDTHGHVDDLARFVGPRTVVTAVEHDPADVNYIPLQENLERLRGMSDFEGRPLEVLTLPMPAPVFFRGQRLPASYANFYIANNVVLMPTFNDPNDRRALAVLAELFPTRKVIGIHAVDLVWGLGTLHCLTQQQPKVGSVSG
jgi:agmatine deiminase